MHYLPSRTIRTLAAGIDAGAKNKGDLGKRCGGPMGTKTTNNVVGNWPGTGGRYIERGGELDGMMRHGRRVMGREAGGV